MSKAAALGSRIRNRASWYSGGALEHAFMQARRFAHRIGWRDRTEYLSLGCAFGNEASGLFSEFCAVIGGLAHLDAWRDLYSGLQVDFGTDGLYYEPAKGPNWWEYYFEPISTGEAEPGRARLVLPWQHDLFADHVERTMTRVAAAALVRRHIGVKPFIVEQVDRFVADRLQRGTIIGVHYRGTDKSTEHPLVPYTDFIGRLRAEVTPGDTIFVATDDQRFLDRLQLEMGHAILSRVAHRSVDGSPVHKAPGNGFQKGEEALIDCLLLSRCSRLVRTPSDLGLVATFFNPELPVTIVNE